MRKKNSASPAQGSSSIGDRSRRRQEKTRAEHQRRLEQQRQLRRDREAARRTSGNGVIAWASGGWWQNGDAVLDWLLDEPFGG